MTTYQYSRLQDPSNLRFVILHLGKSSDDIIISLCESKFDENNPPYYEAVSYVWGSYANPKIVYVDDEGSLPATQNLFVALRQLRF
jgi:hypothetical protein